MKAFFPVVLILGFTAAIYADEAPPIWKPIWKPVVGDSWTYQVVVEVQKGTELPTGVDGQKIENLEGKTRASYTQTHVYHGLKSMKKDGSEVHAFYVSNGEQLEQIEYMNITDDAVEAAGSKQEGQKPSALKPLSKAIPLVKSEWKGGEGFPFKIDLVVGGRKISIVRKYKVLGWETLETEAGKFKAMHVQVTGMNGPMEMKRSYWFTPGTGFIKEVKKYYLGDKIVLAQTRVLEEVAKKGGQ